MTQSSDRSTTSHFAVNEDCCRKMAAKYGWTLLEARRRMAARDPLVVECIFKGDAQFPQSLMDFSGGSDQ
jgi:hypothetical protein